MPVADNLRRLEERIDRARLRAGRTAPVTLVAVTKGRSPAQIREALEAGVTEVGENRVQEAVRKWPELADAFIASRTRRHMIGHLQRNKAAAAVELFDLIQSVDSLPLAGKISTLATQRGWRIPVFLEVNAGTEESKFGFAPAELEEAFHAATSLPGIEVAGLMTLAPLDAGEAALRSLFGATRERFERLSAAQGSALRHLSMGMSGDFELAVEEGATMVRIGTALFA